MNWKNKKIIVTGGAGVIGTPLIEKLIIREAIVKCFNITPKPKGFPENVQYYKRDLSLLNPSEFISFDPEIIFHLAAIFEKTEEDPTFWELNFTNNVVLSHKVIDAARCCKKLKKFIFASSYLVYDSSQYLFKKPAEPVALKENDKIDVKNLYALAKHYTEKELNFTKSFSSVSARIFRVYGRNSRDFISRSIRAAINKDSISLFSKENSFDYVFADDVAEGLIKLGELDIGNGIFNLGSGRVKNVGEVISILKNHFPDLKVEVKDKQDTYENSCADMAAFKEATGWQPSTTLDQGIKELISYEIQKENKN